VSFFCGDATLTPEPRHPGLVAVLTSAPARGPLGGLMSMLLTSEEILDKIRKAFAPYHVVAELQDYHRQLGFRVYDTDNETIDTFEGNLVQDLKNPANLKRMILKARSAVERQQRELKPWSFEG
jgi:hypothetical protein